MVRRGKVKDLAGWILAWSIKRTHSRPCVAMNLYCGMSETTSRQRLFTWRKVKHVRMSVAQMMICTSSTGSLSREPSPCCGIVAKAHLMDFRMALDWSSPGNSGSVLKLDGQRPFSLGWKNATRRIAFSVLVFSVDSVVDCEDIIGVEILLSGIVGLQQVGKPLMMTAA